MPVSTRDASRPHRVAVSRSRGGARKLRLPHRLGVSRDAGVPTGADVFRLAIGDLYRLETVSEHTPTEDELNAWLVESEREPLGYSDILELIAP